VFEQYKPKHFSTRQLRYSLQSTWWSQTDHWTFITKRWGTVPPSYCHPLTSLKVKIDRFYMLMTRPSLYSDEVLAVSQNVLMITKVKPYKKRLRHSKAILGSYGTGFWGILSKFYSHWNGLRTNWGWQDEGTPKLKNTSFKKTAIFTTFLTCSRWNLKNCRLIIENKRHITDLCLEVR